VLITANSCVYCKVVANVVHGMHFKHDAPPRKEGASIMSGLLSSAAASTASPSMQPEGNLKTPPPVLASLPLLARNPSVGLDSRRGALDGAAVGSVVPSLLTMPVDNGDISPLLDDMSALGDDAGTIDDDRVSLNAAGAVQSRNFFRTNSNAPNRARIEADSIAPEQQDEGPAQALKNAHNASMDFPGAVHSGDQGAKRDDLFLMTGTLRDRSLDSKDTAMSSKSGVTMTRSSYGPNTVRIITIL